MALLRVRHPGAPPKDIDLGPECHGWPKAWMTMRRPIDVAIIRSASRQRYDLPAVPR